MQPLQRLFLLFRSSANKSAVVVLTTSHKLGLLQVRTRCGRKRLRPPVFKESATVSTPAAVRVQSFGTTVFAEYSALSLEYDAINLGQGFPDFPAPDFVIEAARTALSSGYNQYARSAGHPRLVNALAAVYSPVFDRELDPLTQIVVTTGATEGIFATMQGLVDPGDEVILIEPFYDSYPAAVIMAGGTPVYIPLRATAGTTSAAGWRIDIEELRAAINPKTKLLVINTPLNPVGKMYSREELVTLAQIAQEHDLLVLSDEVYEWMTYDGTPHVRMATLPGMWERTITLGSAGKTFSVTGWKIGWAIAPEPLAHAVLMAHQWIPFAVTTPLQEAVGAAFEQVEERNYLHELSVHVSGQTGHLAVGPQRCRTPAGDAARQLFYSGGYHRPGHANCRPTTCATCRSAAG